MRLLETRTGRENSHREGDLGLSAVFSEPRGTPTNEQRSQGIASQMRNRLGDMVASDRELLESVDEKVAHLRCHTHSA
jgi:hypothetical protein